jgi:NADH-quinone oxidoreductase subunit M
LILFFAFWLLTRLTTFLLLGSDPRLAWEPDSAQMRMQFLISTATAATLIVIVIAGVLIQRSTLSLSTLLADPLNRRSQTWMFWCVVAAMAITSGLLPLLHLGKLGCCTSSATQVLISGLVVNVGGYGLIRFGMSLFPMATVSFAPLMIALGMVGLLYGAVLAATSSSLGSTLVYWNMAQMSLAVIGMFSLQNLSLHGVIIGFLGRGLGTAALLILPESQAHLKNHTTLTAIALACLSLVGVPGLAGFSSQSVLVMGILRLRWRISASLATNRLLDWGTYGVVALGLLLGTWAIWRSWQRLSRDAAATTTQSALAQRTLIAMPLLFVLLIVGLRPQPFSNQVGPSVFRLLGDINSRLSESSSDVQAKPMEREKLPPFTDPSPPLGGQSLLWRENEIADPFVLSSAPKLYSPLRWDRSGTHIAFSPPPERSFGGRNPGRAQESPYGIK